MTRLMDIAGWTLLVLSAPFVLLATVAGLLKLTNLIVNRHDRKRHAQAELDAAESAFYGAKALAEAERIVRDESIRAHSEREDHA